METNKTALIIEDDSSIADLVRLHLRDLGFKTDIAIDGISGLQKVFENNYSLIILDLMLPRLDGYDVCKTIREDDKKTPILMLTSKSEELDKVLGLELGADDYITKPFSIRELMARVKAILRRTNVRDQPSDENRKEGKIFFDDLMIDLDNRKVSIAGKPVELTVKEYDLLLLFAKKPGRTYSRQQLLDLVWGYQFMGYEHTVNSHINRLRNKIEKDPANPFFIQTVWGVGYRFIDLTEIEK